MAASLLLAFQQPADGAGELLEATAAARKTTFTSSLQLSMLIVPMSA